MEAEEGRRQHPAFEEYLEALFELREEGEPARPADLARRLGVSRPAVTQMIQRLTEAGLARRSPEGGLVLTASGTRRARTVVRRHRLAERLLIDVLGLPWHLAHEEACRLEHAITPTVEARLEALLGHPATSPFGNPIPRGVAARASAGAVSLRRLTSGQAFEILHIREGAQLEPDLVRYLIERGLKPGWRGRVRSQTKEGADIASGRASLFVPAKAASLVIVRPDAHATASA